MKKILFILLALPLAGIAQSNKELFPNLTPAVKPVIRINCGTTKITNPPLMLINGFVIDQAVLSKVNPGDILSIDVFKDSKALLTYGDKGKYGVINITAKQETVKDLVQKGVIKPTL